MKWEKIKHQFIELKPGDYVRQISVVVIGVLITFGGNALIVNNSVQRDIRSSISLIIEELKENQIKLDGIITEFKADEHISALFGRHNMLVRNIPEDSLKQFRYIFGKIRSFSYSKNALNIFNNSMLAQQISDKTLLLSLNNAYDKMEGVKVSLNGYYDLKQEVIVPFHLSMTDEQIKLMDEGGYELWEIYLADTKVRNFLRIAEKYYTDNYLSDVKEYLDGVINTLEDRFQSS